jgi:hypothetical protein
MLLLGIQLQQQEKATSENITVQNQQQQDLSPELLIDRKPSCLRLPRTSTKIVGICRKLEHEFVLGGGFFG